MKSVVGLLFIEIKRTEKKEEKTEREKQSEQTHAAIRRPAAAQGDQLFRCNDVNHSRYHTASLLLFDGEGREGLFGGGEGSVCQQSHT